MFYCIASYKLNKQYIADQYCIITKKCKYLEIKCFQLSKLTPLIPVPCSTNTINLDTNCSPN